MISENLVPDGGRDREHGDEHRELERGLVGEAGAAQGCRNSTWQSSPTTKH